MNYRPHACQSDPIQYSNSDTMQDKPRRCADVLGAWRFEMSEAVGANRERIPSGIASRLPTTTRRELLGSKATRKRSRMTPVPAELAVVEPILFMWRQGKTFAAIAATLVAEGARTKLVGSCHASTAWNVVQRRHVYVDAQKAS